MDWIFWMFIVFFPIILLIIVLAIFNNGNNNGRKLIEKASLIKFGMTKEEVFEILEHREPREITKNESKKTERYKWVAGQNTYTRHYIKGSGTSVGSSSHNRRSLTVIFKDNKVIEISTK